MATISVVCRKGSNTTSVVKNGKAPTGIQRFYCRSCCFSFQLEYRYNANQPGTAEQIVAMAMNGSGIRDTGRVLEISPTTVLSHLKNSILLRSPHCPSIDQK